VNKCHRISWEDDDVGSMARDSFLPLSVTVQYMCSALQSHSFILPNIELKNLRSRIHHEKL
jgi:hypothetical protein